MAIPNYQTLMLPLLKLANDNKEHSTKETLDHLINIFNISEAEQQELLPSGQAIIKNRVGWATTYLKKAQLIEPTRRAHFKITRRGKELLIQNPSEITNSLLFQFQEFQEFVSSSNTGSNSSVASAPANVTSTDQTPEEIMEAAHFAIRKALAQEILLKVQALPPTFFEKLVVELLVKMGYGGSIKDAGRALGKSGDGGIDGIIKEDKLGLDMIFIQAKRWSDTNSVGRPELQGFVGALAGHGAKKGVFITTSRFTAEAKAYTPRNETKIVLIDGEQLAQYMIDYNLGVTPVSIYEVKRIDTDFFGED